MKMTRIGHGLMAGWRMDLLKLNHHETMTNGPKVPTSLTFKVLYTVAIS